MEKIALISGLLLVMSLLLTVRGGTDVDVLWLRVSRVMFNLESGGGELRLHARRTWPLSGESALAEFGIRHGVPGRSSLPNIVGFVVDASVRTSGESPGIYLRVSHGAAILSTVLPVGYWYSVRRLQRDKRLIDAGKCPNCQYRVGSTDVCPACSTDIESSRNRRPLPRQRPWFWLGMGVVVLGVPHALSGLFWLIRLWRDY